MTEEQKIKREELRLKMNELQDEALKYRNQIELIDRQDEEELRNSILHRCYKLNSGTKEHPSHYNGYARVNYFNDQFQPVGTTINWFTDEPNSMMICEINNQLFMDWITEGEEIPQAEFDSYINKFAAGLKNDS